MLSPRLTLSLALAGAVAALAGCPAPSGTPKGASTGSTAAKASPGALNPAAKSSLEGLVTAPAGLVAAGGLNMVAAGGGNLIGVGGSTMVAAGGGNWRLLQAQAAPLVGAEVVVTDGLGTPIAGIARVKTDKSGRYKLTGLPASGAFAVQVGFKTDDGKNAGTLVTLAEGGATKADVTASTTCVAVALLGEKGKAVKGFDGEAFQTAVGLIDKEAATDAPPPMWDRARIVSWMGKLEAKLDALRDSLSRVGARLDSIESKLDALLARDRSPGPTTAPSAVATATTAPGASPTAPGATATPAGTVATATPGGTGTPKSALKPLVPIGGATADKLAMGDNNNLMAAGAGSGPVWVGLPDGAAQLDAAGAVTQYLKIGGGQVQPRAIAVDPAGNLWAADAYSGGVVRFGLDGNVGVAGPGTGATATGVAIASDGSVWLASEDRRVLHFDATGTKLGEISPRSATPGGIAVDGANALWLTYPELDKIVKVDGAGKVLLEVAADVAPGRLLVDGLGALWTRTYATIIRIAPDGKVVGIDSQTTRFTADGKGLLWAAEASALKAFDATGKLLETRTLDGTPQAIAGAPAGGCYVLLDGTLTLVQPK